MRLCMISLDAVAQPDADRLLGLPALSALAAEGVFCRNVKTVYPTLTYPIHASLLTGCRPLSTASAITSPSSRIRRLRCGNGTGAWGTSKEKRCIRRPGKEK